jgi:hypothetical protein
VVIAIIGILASMLLPTLAKAKKKANRLKCANNIGQISKAHIAFAGDHQVFPWLMLQSDNHEAYKSDYRKADGTSSLSYANNHHMSDIRFTMTLPGIRRPLDSSKMVLSPSDPKMKAGNQSDNKNGKLDGGKWAASNWAGRFHVSHHAGSYGQHLDGDDQTPQAMLSATRNIDGQDPGYWHTITLPGSSFWGKHFNKTIQRAVWTKHILIGPAGQVRRTMSGFDAGTGNWSTSDGATVQGDQAQLDEVMKETKAAKGGSNTGRTSIFSSFLW